MKASSAPHCRPALSTDFQCASSVVYNSSIPKPTANRLSVACPYHPKTVIYKQVRRRRIPGNRDGDRLLIDNHSPWILASIRSQSSKVPSANVRSGQEPSGALRLDVYTADSGAVIQYGQLWSSLWEGYLSGSSSWSTAIPPLGPISAGFATINENLPGSCGTTGISFR